MDGLLRHINSVREQGHTPITIKLSPLAWKRLVEQNSWAPFHPVADMKICNLPVTIEGDPMEEGAYTIEVEWKW